MLAARETAHRPASPPPEAQLRAVNQAVGRMNVPWGNFFEALQGVSAPHVALLAIEPEASTLTLKGVAEAATPDAMIQYLEALKHTGFFKTVTLSHHEINMADPNAPIRFKFDATW
jgi:Tfp pilus assembly protein PilN